MEKYVKVLALSTDGSVEKTHCPLVHPRDREILENTFNYRVRNERIIELEIKKEFKCNTKTGKCLNCPFYKTDTRNK